MWSVGHPIASTIQYALQIVSSTALSGSEEQVWSLYQNYPELMQAGPVLVGSSCCEGKASKTCAAGRVLTNVVLVECNMGHQIRVLSDFGWYDCQYSIFPFKPLYTLRFHHVSFECRGCAWSLG